MDTVNILGVPIACINMETCLALIEVSINEGIRSYINIVNVHSIMEAQSNTRLMKSHYKALLCTPDGMPTVWIGKHYGHKSMGRVYGPDLMEELIKKSTKMHYSHFFFGGEKGVAELMRDRFVARYPGLRIVGVYSPAFRTMNENEETGFKNLIEKLSPDVLWVALGCPKQEIWMSEHVGLLDAKIMIGVGAAFNFHAGLIKQAPDFIQNLGLEWAFRLCAEPGRLWRRYLRTNTIFIYKILKQVINKLHIA